ncbi:ABC transporter substrate-binding protein [Oceanicella actignis]|uniref:Branched-chain amino acid transport system substrate-binding protein n=1 Tax=Oceanicella actignis TaxID=1189325 RepID=A0A1M7T7Z1_9RHOB|nr:ABC transporter substrate-binding protein [Oceanicella actignis]SET48717.1 amino acid/amide ABC transporter substrate-binding protein, HAAT family [Oceanicella actignis]SHN66816.1 branched-chain amino acid transport system substrate-binding protein [Oceanicella actignis]
MMRKLTLAAAALAGAIAGPLGGSSAAAAERTLRIGVSDALTGGASVYGLPQANAIKMAADEINAAGGVKVGGDSYMLDVIAYDDKGNPTEATNAVRKLIDFDEVKYILGFCCSGAASAVASFIADEDAVMLVGNAAERSITARGIPNLVRTRPPADYTGAAAGAFVGKRGHKRVAVLGALDVGFYALYVDAFEKELNKAGGQIIARESFGLKDRDMTPQLTKIREMNPDALLVVGYVEPAAFIYRQSVELGMDIPRYGFTSGSEEQFLRVATSEQMEGVWDLRPTELTLQSATETGLAYHRNYTERYGMPPSPSSPYAYDNVYALKHAIEAAGTVDDTRAVARALRELAPPPEAVMQYLPVDGKMFDRNGQAYTANGAFQWRGGKWVYVEELPSDAKAYSEFLASLR